jgi:hypothetical protein
MSQKSKQYKTREEANKLIEEAAKGMPIFEGPFRYDPNLRMSFEQQLRIYEDTHFVESFLKREKIDKNA